MLLAPFGSRYKVDEGLVFRNSERRLKMKCKYLTLLASMGFAAFLLGPSPALAQVSLGAAEDFAALGGTGVKCTVPNPPLSAAVTISGGDVGSGSVASTTVTGFPGFTPGANRCSLDGDVLLNQTEAITDLITAYNALRDNNTCPSDIASHNLVGNLTSGLQGATLEPGVYCITGTGLLTSRLTLNGNSNAVWIFKAESDLTPKNGSVVMAGGGNACNVYWQVGSAVDLLNTAFVGNVLAGTAITFTGEAPPTGTASSLKGRALAKSLVTMTGANISACTGGGPPPPSCDKDHKRHKYCKHHKNDKPHCDGDRDGHGNGHGGDDDDDDHDGHGNGHGGDNDDDDHDDDHDDRDNHGRHGK